MAAKRALAAASAEELGRIAQELGHRPFRGKQLGQWIHRRGATEFGAMHTLPADFRAGLGESYSVDSAHIAEERVSRDGTRKWLLDTSLGRQVETVYIPEDTRGTLCVSSQVGCSLSCSFCHTGTQALEGNLGASDIVGQVLAARRALGDFPRRPNQAPAVSNVVFMGQGEPLLNYRALRTAVRAITDPERLAFPRRRVTVSTSGIAPIIPRLASELGIRLAISLHAPEDELRSRIMPINRTYPLRVLMDACHRYNEAAAASAPAERDRRITFEYVMLKGVNDDPALADGLASLVEGLPAHFNLIPFNPWPGAEYECSDPGAIEAFRQALVHRGLFASVRTSRGDDILAACGQLRSAGAEPAA